MLSDEYDSDSDKEGDGQYFDDVSKSDSWGGERSLKKLPGSSSSSKNKNKNAENLAPKYATLNLANIHNEIAWGDNIKVDREEPRLNSRQKDREHRTAQECNKIEREESRKANRVVNVVPKEGPKTAYNSYRKFEKLAEKDESKDWYITNDNTPYLSSGEKRIKDDLRDRGEVAFHNVSGKRSAMKLPNKYGVVCGGPYPKCGKVQVSAQLDVENKEKWMDKEKKGWMANGDRQKAQASEQKGKGRR